MRHCSTLPFVLLALVLAGCGASASRANLEAAELEARSARAEAIREHVQLIELDARLLELEHRLASQTHPCEGTPDPRVAPARPRTEPLRSQGDFLAEARVAAPVAVPPIAEVAVGTAPRAAIAASDRGRVEQLLNELRKYGFDLQSGLSFERREALRVLLRRERQLDLMNPWEGQ